jgi:hypothetical protein
VADVPITPLLGWLGIYFMVFFALGLAGAVSVAPGVADEPPEVEQSEGGFFNALGAIFGAIWTGVSWFMAFLTFNVEGAPAWVRIPISIFNGGSILLVVLRLVRGGG